MPSAMTYVCHGGYPVIAHRQIFHRSVQNLYGFCIPSQSSCTFRQKIPSIPNRKFTYLCGHAMLELHLTAIRCSSVPAILSDGWCFYLFFPVIQVCDVAHSIAYLDVHFVNPAPVYLGVNHV